MTFSSQDIKTEELRQRYIELLKRSDVYPTKSNWRYISSSRMRGLCSLLYGKYLTALTIGEVDREELHIVAVEEFPRYLVNVDMKEAVEAVYGDVYTDPDAAVELICKCELFDAGRLVDLLSFGHLRIVMGIIEAYRREYDEVELLAMRRLVEMLDALPELGRIEARQGIFGRQTRYICPDGHSNPADNVYCSHCGLDIHGLKENDYARIDSLKKRIEALESLVKNDLESI